MDSYHAGKIKGEWRGNITKFLRFIFDKYIIVELITLHINENAKIPWKGSPSLRFH